jgi:osmoprotectant transport system substrate-binding protein
MGSPAMPSPRRLAPLLGLVLALGLAACGSGDATGGASGRSTAQTPGAGRPPVTLGTRTASEQILLGQLYKQALEAKGFTVALKANISSTEIADKALRSRQIDLYPAYVRDAGAAREHGFTLLRATPFNDVEALAVLPQFARAHAVKSIADLAGIGGLRLGAPPEFLDGEPGLADLDRVYGLSDVRFAPLTLGLQYGALDDGKLDAAVVSTTDGELQGGRYVVLDDPRQLFGSRHVAPVVAARVLTAEGPAFARTLDAVSRTLTTGAMQELNAAVALDEQSPADVAQEFLRTHRLA